MTHRRTNRATRRVTSRFVAGVAATGLILAACGGDDAATSPSVTFATVPEASGEDPAPSTTTVGATTSADPVATDAPSTDPATTEPPVTEPPVTQPLGEPQIELIPVASARQPVDLAWRAGDTTLFVVEQAGTIVPLRDGAVGDPVLDITDRTGASGEQGLLGLAFAPSGELAYVNHTDDSGDTVIAEYVVAGDGTFDPSSRRELLTIGQPYGNHNGGNVMFGPDGMLYIGMGDGGSAGDPERRALNVSDLLGKILRIDPTPTGDQAYTVPADNPFVGIEGARPEIWSVGVRNPWRMSFDRETGDLWFGDVGQNLWEEISVGWAADGGGRGVNYGWSAFEATTPYNADQPIEGATPPIHEYAHGDAGCSVTGGPVYRGEAIPELAGWYLYGDFCSGNVVGLRVADRTVVDTILLASAGSVAAIREDPAGELWVLSLDGTIHAVTRAA